MSKRPIVLQAKLFQLVSHSEEDVEWLEQATGMPMFVKEENLFKLRFISENSDHPSPFYEVTVTDNIHFFQRDEDDPDRNKCQLTKNLPLTSTSANQNIELSVVKWWHIKENVQMALSFRDTAGAQTIWDKIQAYLATQALEIKPRIPGPCMLEYKIPQPSPSTLHQILLELRNIPDIEKLDRISSIFLIKRDLLPKLRRLFLELECSTNPQDIPVLETFFEVMSLVMGYANSELIYELLSDEYYMFLLGALEYDRNFARNRPKHREWVAKKVKFSEIVSFKNEEVMRKVQLVYRLEYIRDCVLGHVLEQTGLRNHTLVILHGYKQILIYMISDRGNDYLNEMFALLRVQDISAYRLLNEITKIAKHVDTFVSNTHELQNLLYSRLTEKEVFEILVANIKAFQDQKDFKISARSRIKSFEELSEIVSVCLNVIIGSLNVSGKYFKGYCSSEVEKTLRYPLINMFLRLSAKTKTTFKNQYADVLSRFVDDSEPHPICSVSQNLFLNLFLQPSTAVSYQLLLVLNGLVSAQTALLSQKVKQIVQKIINQLSTHKQTVLLGLQTLNVLAKVYIENNQVRQDIASSMKNSKLVAILEQMKGNNCLSLSVLLETLFVLHCKAEDGVLVFLIEEIKKGRCNDYAKAKIIKAMETVKNSTKTDPPQLKRQKNIDIHLGEEDFERAASKNRKL